MPETRKSPETDLPARLSQPARRALIGAGCLRMELVAKLSEKELKKLHGMGPKAIEQLRVALAEQGLSFAAEPDSLRAEK